MPNRSSKTFSYVLLSGILALGIFAVFILPWSFPPKRFVISDSYNVGFNNTLALLGLGITLLLLTCWRLFCLPSRSESLDVSLPLDDMASNNLEKAKSTRIYATVVGGICVLAVAVNVAWWMYQPLNYMGEMISFLPCIELILLGKTPYTQFQFNYGPLYLYLPVGIVLWSGKMVGAETGYLITHLIFLVMGLVLLAYVTSILPQRQRILLFVLLALPLILNISLGSNYTPIRFITPFAALLWLHRLCESHFKKDTTAFSWKIVLSVSVAIIGCFGISPETGIIFLAAFLIYFGFFMRGQTRASRIAVALYAISGMAVGLAFLAVLSKAYFVSILSFGGGGYNFPIVPGLFIVLYLLCLAWIIPLIGGWGLRNHGPSASLALAWAGMVALYAAPALGRCDGGHIFCNGLGAFIAFFALLPNRLKIGRWFAYATFTAVFSFGVPYITYLVFKESIEESIRLHNLGLQKADRRFWLTAYDPVTLGLESEYDRELSSYPQIGTPFGTHEPLEIYLKRSKKYIPEFYSAPAGGAFTQEQVTAKCLEIGKMSLILVPISSANRTWSPQLEEAFAQQQQKSLRELLCYPITYRLVQQPLMPDIILATYVREHFTIIREWNAYYIMARKNLVKTKPVQ